MSVTKYQQEIIRIETELAVIETELQATPEGQAAQTALLARRGSLLRSLDWYRRRLPRKIEALGISVGDDISTVEANG